MKHPPEPPLSTGGDEEEEPTFGGLAAGGRRNSHWEGSANFDWAELTPRFHPGDKIGGARANSWHSLHGGGRATRGVSVEYVGPAWVVASEVKEMLG